jgi:hypothetical protein
MVENKPLKIPLRPFYFIIDVRQCFESLYFFYLSFCMMHFTNSTGDTIKEFTNPAKAPFYIPSIKLNSCLFIIFL